MNQRNNSDIQMAMVFIVAVATVFYTMGYVAGYLIGVAQ